LQTTASVRSPYARSTSTASSPAVRPQHVDGLLAQDVGDGLDATQVKPLDPVPVFHDCLSRGLRGGFPTITFAAGP
jgi:hypothetical protein